MQTGSRLCNAGQELNDRISIPASPHIEMTPEIIDPE
jgi:hypothetical protein